MQHPLVPGAKEVKARPRHRGLLHEDGFERGGCNAVTTLLHHATPPCCPAGWCKVDANGCISLASLASNRSRRASNRPDGKPFMGARAAHQPVFVRIFCNSSRRAAGTARVNSSSERGEPGGTSGSTHGLGYLFTAFRRQGLIADELVLQLTTFLRSLDLFLELIVLNSGNSHSQPGSAWRQARHR